MRCMKTTSCIALLLAIVGCSARPEPYADAQWSDGKIFPATDDFGYGRTAASTVEMAHTGDGHSDLPFTLLVKYIIRPSLAKEFVGGYLKFREGALKAKGAKTINLSKPLSDNLLFYGYEEWESKADFFKFVMEEDSPAKYFAKYIEKENIPIVLTQLVPAVPYHKDGHRTSASKGLIDFKGFSTSAEAVKELLEDATDSLENLVHGNENQDKALSHDTGREHKTIILTKFVVRPSAAIDFIDAVDKVTKSVAKHEKASVVYGLSKPLDDDVTFYSYAVWDDKDAVKQHLESDYVKALLKYIVDNDIYLKTSLLLPIEAL